MDSVEMIKSEAAEDFQELIGPIESLCRACLELADPPNPLFLKGEDGNTLADLIWTCAGIRLVKTEGLPEAVCFKCSEDLSTANRFRIRVHRSDHLLQRYSQTNVKQESDVPIDFNEPDSLSSSNREKKTKKKPKIKSESSLNDADSNNITVTEIKIEFDETDHYAENDPIGSEDNINLDETETPTSKKYKCKICNRPLSTKYSLKSHIQRMHCSNKKRNSKITGWGSERRYHCTECEYATPHSQSLVYHMRIHTGEKPYKCDICGRSFSQPGSLTGHKKVHSDKMYFTCTQCGKQFKYREAYEVHKNVHIEERKFKCTLCSKGLKSKKSLEAHMNRHYNIRNHNCETCGSTFVTRVELVNHSKIHKADKKFGCNLCSFKTYMKKSLEVHLRRHTGERPFKCDLCDLSCYTKGELKCHQRKHTKEKNYSCPMCEMKFIHSPSVNKHMLKVHGLKYNRLNIVDRRIIK